MMQELCYKGRRHSISIFLITCIVNLLVTGVAQSEETTGNWPAFQNAGESSLQTSDLPLTWAPDTNVAWKASLEGYGQSTPIISAGQIYVTSVSGDLKNKFHLAAFQLLDGQKLWQKSFDNPSPKENTPMTSRAAPSPVADEQGCYAFFEGGILVALQRDGNLRWQRNLIEEYGKADARHGLASSLEQDDERIYVWIERSEDPYVLAVEKESGKNLWKVRGSGSTTWSSPRLINTDWGAQLVCSASGKIFALDPNSGKRLWEFTEIANNTSCTPIPVGKNRFLIGASDGRGGDTGGGAEFNGVLEIEKQNDGYQVGYVWKADKASSSFGSPIVAAGNACIINRTGVLHRLDIETGEPVAVRRTDAGGIWATPIVAGDRLYLFGQKGTTAVISLTDGKELAENRLWESGKEESPFSGGPVLYAAAPAPPYLILRRGDSIFAVKEK